MGRYKISYSCGLIIEINGLTWCFEEKEWDELYDKGCPIHGKSCKCLKVKQNGK